MPLKKCSNDGKSGYKWGDSGNCYTGPDAKKKAIKQGVAIEGPEKFTKMAKEYGMNVDASEIEFIVSCIYDASISHASVELTAALNQSADHGFTEELTEDNFIVPASEDYYEGYEDDDVEEWDIAANRPGLWENIRRKKEREGKKYRPAKPGDKDRPDPEAWKRAQSEDFKPHIMYDKDGKPHKANKPEDHERMEKMGYTHEAEALYEYENPKTGEVFRFRRKGVYKDGGMTLRFVGKAEYKVDAAEYQGRKVTLNKPFRTPNGPKKSAVYVKNEKGNVVIVRFGDPNMKIKKSDPKRRKSFRARHNCSNPGVKWKARYWSCRAW
jgi:hypothetical protein